jgi:hypothetical protein
MGATGTIDPDQRLASGSCPGPVAGELAQRAASSCWIVRVNAGWVIVSSVAA